MVGFGGAMAFACLGRRKETHRKKSKMGGALNFGSRCLMMAYNNQPRIGRSDNEDVRAEAHGRESAWGDTVPAFGASN
jgi:hypothetical protein